MDWLSEFQRSFREPVMAFVGSYWWLLALLAVVAFLAVVLGFEPQRRWSSGSLGEGFDDGSGD